MLPRYPRNAARWAESITAHAFPPRGGPRHGADGEIPHGARPIPQLGAHVSTLEIQDGKLLVRGEAPSLEMKHRIWDQIMTVDPLYPDLICEIRVNP